MQRRWVVSSDYRSIIEALIQARKDRGVSQRALAAKLNKPPSFTNKIENLERRLDILEFIAIARALELDSAKLITLVSCGLPNQIDLNA
jgi:ribosome-binding protein aMBF1 (putative translation factor)